MAELERSGDPVRLVAERVGVGVSAGSRSSRRAGCTRLPHQYLDQYLDEVLRVLRYWRRYRSVELAPKYWATTRAKARPPGAGRAALLVHDPACVISSPALPRGGAPERWGR